MASEIVLTGVSTPDGDIRKILVYFDIAYNGNTYHWFDYVDAMDGSAAMTYLNGNKAAYEADLDAKEAAWIMAPKTKEIDGITCDVQKEEVVHATPTKPKTLAERIYDLEHPQ